MITTPTLLAVALLTLLALGWRHFRRAAVHNSTPHAQALEQLQQSHAAELGALRDELAAARTQATELARSEGQLRQIVAMLPVALFLKDPDSRIVMMNAACEEIFGVGFAKLSGTSGSNYYPADQMEGFLAADRAAFASGVLRTEEEWVWHAGRNEDRRVQTYKQPMYDAEGKPALLIGMCIDVTERMRADEALQRSLRQSRKLSDHREALHEDERKRQAQYAHDAVGQNLMALKLDAATLHAQSAISHPRLHGRTSSALDALDGAILAVRSLINELHPSTLELGLPAAVDWLLKQLECRGGIHSQLHILADEGQLALRPRETWAVFRMIQEALANIAAFARATRIDVTLSLAADGLMIIIGDNGLHGTQEGAEGAFGMLVLRERVTAFGGELVASTIAGRGTTLAINLPGMAKREAAASRLDESQPN